MEAQQKVATVLAIGAAFRKLQFLQKQTHCSVPRPLLHVSPLLVDVLKAVLSFRRCPGLEGDALDIFVPVIAYIDETPSRGNHFLLPFCKADWAQDTKERD